jgi:hypothetical protein
MYLVETNTPGGYRTPRWSIDHQVINGIHHNGTGFEVNAGNLIRIQRYQEDHLLGAWNITTVGATSSLAISNKYARGNTKTCGRCEVNFADSTTHDPSRAELVQYFNTGTVECWVGLSMLFPKSTADDVNPEIITHWHEVDQNDIGEGARSPALSLVSINGQFRFDIKWSSLENNSGPGGGTLLDGQTTIALGAIPKEKWIDWVFHIKHGHDETGIVEVWKDGTKVIDRVGMPNSYNDTTPPYLRCGIYKWPWKFLVGAPPAIKQRVLYFGPVRVGNENSSYDEVAPR